MSTANNVRPSVSPTAPAVRAATISMSDDVPCTTNCFCPVSLKPLPLRSATQAIFSGRCFTPSSIAMPITVSPAKMPGNQRSRIALSASFNASTAATDVVRNGEGDRLRPISSSTIPASIWPMPMPPSASGMRMPVKPISANCFHRPWLKPSLQPMSRNLRKWVTGASLAMKSRALSRSMFWSSFNVIAIFLSSRHFEDAFGYDVQHDFAGAAFNRVRLGPQPIACL